MTNYVEREGKRISELQLLSSMFIVGDELFFDDQSISDLLNSDSSKVSALDTETINFRLKIDNVAEMTVSLPPGYPSGQLANTELPSSGQVKPSITLRLLPHVNCTTINERDLADQFQVWLDREASTGQPVVLSAVEWIRSNGKLNDSCPLSDQSNGDRDPDIVATAAAAEACLWIVSHHIRSKIKRRLILDWAGELQLAGCCMPGRPGLIVVEGDSSDASLAFDRVIRLSNYSGLRVAQCDRASTSRSRVLVRTMKSQAKTDEFWRRIRNLTWKAIQLRDRELLSPDNEFYNAKRFPDGFHEILLDNSKRFEWLTSRGIRTEQICFVFGINSRPSTNTHA